MNKLSAISRLGRPKIVLSALAIGSCLLANARPENLAIYSVNAKESKLEIYVHRQGFLKAFGHDHLISARQLSGQVRLVQSNLTESSVDIVVATRSLSVLDPGESEKVRMEVQATMLGEKVLDATQYPQIQFASTSVRAIGQKEGATEIQVEGTLRLHGVEKPVVLPMRVHVEQGDLSADGEFSVRQSDYGIVPVKAGGGAVRVKDELKIRFHIVAGAGAASSALASRQFGHVSNGVRKHKGEFGARAGIRTNTAQKNAPREKGCAEAPGNSTTCETKERQSMAGRPGRRPRGWLVRAPLLRASEISEMHIQWARKGVKA